MTTSRPRPTTAAFSLVETALAVGVIAFAFVSLLALLPVGLANFRSAIDTSVGSQIFQRVVSDAEQADFDGLTAGDTGGAGEFFLLPTRYFDDQGTEVALQTPGSPSPMEGQQIIYHVHVRGTRVGLNPTAPKAPDRFASLPASTGTKRYIPRDSTFLTVQIAHQPGIEPLPLDEHLLWEVPPKRAGSLALATYSAVITRNGFSRKPGS